MDASLAWSTLLISVGVFVAATFLLRERLPRPIVDGVLALAGAGVGVGGLLFLENVSVASWIVAPAVLAAAAIVHVRALFAGAGPFRT